MKMIIVLGLYLILNLAVAMMFRTRGLKKRFVDNQCPATVLLVNLFFAPAWILKGIKYLINRVIA